MNGPAAPHVGHAAAAGERFPRKCRGNMMRYFPFWKGSQSWCGGHNVGAARRDGAPRRGYVLWARVYLRSTKICSQSAAPVFSAECEGITGTALAVPALRTISDVLPSGAYVFVVQSVML
jgi:hypothetical protein